MKKVENHIAELRQDRILGRFNTVILLVFALVIAYPLYFVVIASVSDPVRVNAGDVLFFPKGISFIGYQKVLTNSGIQSGALNTVFYMIFGTSLNVFFTMLGAYALTYRFPGRKFVMSLLTFTMFFSGGMIPNYLLMKGLHLLDTRLVMILPGLISVYNLIIARTFIESNIPAEMYEAAQLDGCTRTRFLFAIVWPLSGAMVAILALFYAVGHWNSYMSAILYLRDRAMFPLQLILREILILNQVSAEEMFTTSDLEAMDNLQRVADTMKYALIIITTLPMMVAYPFVQKFFVKGVMIGSVKG